MTQFSHPTDPTPPPSPVMPPAVANLFGPLHHQLQEIHLKWALFRQLFATDPDRIDLLNRYAHVFFGYTKIIYYDDVILSLFRFTERETTGNKHNLTLQRLAAEVTKADPDFGKTVQADSTTIHALLQPHAGWRDKRMAHNDLATMQARWADASTLTGPSREQVEEILDRMRQLMNRVSVHYGQGETRYDIFLTLPLPGDADTLVWYLQELARYEGPGG